MPPIPVGKPPPYNPPKPGSPGFSNGKHGLNSYLGTFDGHGNPNTGFNPNIGTYAKPKDFTHGGGGLNSATTANTVGGNDYAAWNWEQILNQVLGTALPDRGQILADRWTGMERDSSGDGDHFYIYGVTWGSNHKDALIYLNPALQSTTGPWAAYLNGPAALLWEPNQGYHPSNKVELDPKTFLPPLYAVAAVQQMYLNSYGTLDTMSTALQGDASQFKGEAGGAFAHLINNLLTHTEHNLHTMGLPGQPGSYADMLDAAWVAAEEFLLSVWNAYVGWQQLMQHSPLGAIFAALIAGGVVTLAPGSKDQYQANPHLNPNNSSFGMLSTDAAWLAVEKVAKNLWQSALVAALDNIGQQAFQNLITVYEKAGQALHPLTAKALPSIGSPNSLTNPNVGGGGFNQVVGGMNKDFASIANMIANMEKGMAGAFNQMNKGLGQIPNLGHGIFNGFNQIGQGLGQLGGGPNGQPLLNQNPTDRQALLNQNPTLTQALLNQKPAAPTGFVTTGPPTQALLNQNPPVTQALLNQNPTNRQVLLNQSPLAPTGFVTTGTPPQALLNQNPTDRQALLNQNPQAFQNPPVTQALLNQGPGGPQGFVTTGGQQPLTAPGQLSSPLTQPVTSALQNALAGTNQTQGALNQALASGQVPSSGPLHTALTNALADNGNTQAAINQALASGNPSTAALQNALADNGKTQTALNQALASGQVPSTGPLASSLRTALAGTSRTQAALQNALAGGVPASSSLHSALADNSQTRAALDQALAGGQVPATGPLHSAVQTALADTGKTQAALTQALATGSPSASQLQTALADNNQTRAALQHALASGQVPSTGPLHTALTNALADTGKTNAAIHQAMLSSTPGGAALHQALTSDTAAQGALHRALATGQVPKVGALHDAVQSALTDGGKVQNALNQALAGGGTGNLSTGAIQRALTDNQALQGALHQALASGQVPATGPLHTDLQNALADSQRTSTALHQALAGRGVATEPSSSLLSGGPSSLTSGLTPLTGKPLISPAAPGGAGQLGSGGLGAGLGAGAGAGPGAGGLAGASGLASGATSALPVSSGRFVPPTAGPGGAAGGPAAAAAASGAGGFPMYMPMAGMGGMGGMGMGGMGGGAGQQERERTTWLAEDEDVWGTEPDVAPQVLGRDFDDEDDELSDYADGDRDAEAARRAQARLYGR